MFASHRRVGTIFVTVRDAFDVFAATRLDAVVDEAAHDEATERLVLDLYDCTTIDAAGDAALARARRRFGRRLFVVAPTSFPCAAVASVEREDAATVRAGRTPFASSASPASFARASASGAATLDLLRLTAYLIWIGQAFAERTAGTYRVSVTIDARTGERAELRCRLGERCLTLAAATGHRPQPTTLEEVAGEIVRILERPGFPAMGSRLLEDVEWASLLRRADAWPG